MVEEHLKNWRELPVKNYKAGEEIDYAGTIYRMAYSYDDDDAGEAADLLEKFLQGDGVGETAACGTGACAAAVAAAHAGAIRLPVDVFLTGGTLHIDWDGAGEVLMTGHCQELGTLDTARLTGAGDSL